MSLGTGNCVIGNCIVGFDAITDIIGCYNNLGYCGAEGTTAQRVLHCALQAE